MIQGIDADAVLVDNSDIVYQAVNRLLKKGHTRIAIITGPKSVYTTKERMVGYLRALSDADILYDEKLIISQENDFATGFHGCEALLKQKQPPTAVFTTNYDITMGFITAAQERGLRIPEDIDVFGFDSVETCSLMHPPLPVVQQPDKHIGQTAAQYLLDRLDGYNGDARITRLNCRIAPE